MNSNELWDRNDIQFARLISELKAAGLTPEQMDNLCESMDLNKDQIHELLDRGEEAFEFIMTVQRGGARHGMNVFGSCMSCLQFL